MTETESESFPEVVEFFKALADATRLRIVGLLADQSLCGQELAATLGLSPATVTHHLRSLKKVGLIRERREPPYTYFDLDLGRMQEVMRATVKKDRVQELAAGPDVPTERRRVLNAFFDGESLRSIPSQRRKKEIVFEEILKKIPYQDSYTERDLSKMIQRFHSDFCTIRREFIMGRYMERDRGVYRWADRGRTAREDRVEGASPAR
ncbi:MAG: metalloregulator ArsR/SmtB family transcription factor [Candidatus Eisenbacteria bacterium]|uniref:Metalloregulator ArsR/SmtB family transcription factor n=1 Tax=Eiseniibacteriota bacterium TaxID=2212470 RepID=A0A956M0M9_UNCEI|nr:metalloregulator ArsR/SmtB family transcription factor [Candidatus Eisenbacteria bacterium]